MKRNIILGIAGVGLFLGGFLGGNITAVKAAHQFQSAQRTELVQNDNNYQMRGGQENKKRQSQRPGYFNQEAERKNYRQNASEEQKNGISAYQNRLREDGTCFSFRNNQDQEQFSNEQSFQRNGSNRSLKPLQ